MNNKLEITIETESVTIVSRRAVRGWCEQCGRAVQLVRLTPDALDDFALGQLLRAAVKGKFHLTEPADASFVICLDSLLKNFSEE